MVWNPHLICNAHLRVNWKCIPTLAEMQVSYGSQWAWHIRIGPVTEAQAAVADEIGGPMRVSSTSHLIAL